MVCDAAGGETECCTTLRGSIVLDGSEGGVVGHVDSIMRGNGGSSASVGDVGVMVAVVMALTTSDGGSHRSGVGNMGLAMQVMVTT